jgi:hypothetical protein
VSQNQFFIGIDLSMNEEGELQELGIKKKEKKQKN